MKGVELISDKEPDHNLALEIETSVWWYNVIDSSYLLPMLQAW